MHTIAYTTFQMPVKIVTGRYWWTLRETMLSYYRKIKGWNG